MSESNEYIHDAQTQDELAGNRELKTESQSTPAETLDILSEFMGGYINELRHC